MTLRELMVVATNQGDAFISRDVVTSDVRLSVTRAATEAEFHVSKVEMVAVSSIIEARVLRVCAFSSAFIVELETRVGDGVVEVLLGRPLLVVGVPVHLQTEVRDGLWRWWLVPLHRG